MCYVIDELVITGGKTAVSKVSCTKGDRGGCRSILALVRGWIFYFRSRIIGNDRIKRFLCRLILERSCVILLIVGTLVLGLLRSIFRSVLGSIVRILIRTLLRILLSALVICYSIRFLFCILGVIFDHCGSDLCFTSFLFCLRGALAVFAASREEAGTCDH